MAPSAKQGPAEREDAGLRWDCAGCDGAARAGLLHTAHGAVPTPVFMPVGTAGTVKGMTADAVRSTDAGPLRDRLSEIGQRINDGVEECWKIARAGHALTQARKRIDLAGIQRELTELGPAPTGVPTEASSARDETAAALQSQIATTNRMDTTISSTRDRLRLLNARLDESVTRSIELSVSSTSESAIDQVGSDVSAITTEMEALRQAIEVTNTPMTGTG